MRHPPVKLNHSVIERDTVTLGIRLGVLSSKHNNALFRVRISINSKDGGSDPVQTLVTDLFKVVSKPHVAFGITSTAHRLAAEKRPRAPVTAAPPTTRVDGGASATVSAKRAKHAKRRRRKSASNPPTSPSLLVAAKVALATNAESETGGASLKDVLTALWRQNLHLTAEVDRTRAEIASLRSAVDLAAQRQTATLSRLDIRPADTHAVFDPRRPTVPLSLPWCDDLGLLQSPETLPSLCQPLLDSGFD